MQPMTIVAAMIKERKVISRSKAGSDGTQICLIGEVINSAGTRRAAADVAADSPVKW